MAITAPDRTGTVTLTIDGREITAAEGSTIFQAAKAAGMTIEEYTKVTAKAHTTGRIVEPEEIAELAVFLASDASRTTTGQSIMMGFA